MHFSSKNAVAGGMVAVIIALSGIAVGLATRKAEAQTPALPAAEERGTKSSAVGIAEVKLVAVQSVSGESQRVEIRPWEFKAYETKDGDEWDVTLLSDDATGSGITLHDVGSDGLVMGIDLDKGRYGSFQVPKGIKVKVIACNPNAKGKYLVERLSVVEGRPRKQKMLVTVVAGETGPSPNVNPDKKDTNPPPGPTKAVKVIAVIVEETADLSAKRSKFFESEAIRKRWKDKGHSPWIVCDKDVKDPATGKTPTKLVPYLSRSKDKVLPQLYIVDAESGRVLYEGPAYSEESDFLKLLDKIGA